MTGEFSISSLGNTDIDSPVSAGYFVNDHMGILLDPLIPFNSKIEQPVLLEQAGPRKKLFFDPKKTGAAIVTCGGLCPGLNDVIRAVTMILWYRYGVSRIIGARYGYAGMVEPGPEPVKLHPEMVEDIHQHGGTILGTSRGGQDPAAMTDWLVKHNINIMFAIGGDGTQRGALDTANEIEKRKLPISVVGIPKTIDNDLSFTDRTFGFETAVAMSQPPILSAHMEAKAVHNGVGLVKLMGRDSGFVAAYASLASSDVNLVLVPEVPFTTGKLIEFLIDRLNRKSHAVIVAAEGAGQNLVVTEGIDASGNKRFGDIGIFLKDFITTELKKRGVPVSLKYIDPSYIIRSAPANADDSVFCFRLGENAVHAAMTGRTKMLVSLVNGHFVHIPLSKAVAKRKKIDPEGAFWQSVIDNTGQPILE